MALYAVVLKDAGVLLVDADGFVKILQREARGMPEAVLGLGQPFRQALVRQMAVRTVRVGVMAGPLPALVLVAHDVAVHARGGVAAEVRRAFRVPEREHAETEQDADERAQHHEWQTKSKSAPPACHRHLLGQLWLRKA